jgi:hypothetical protein
LILKELGHKSYLKVVRKHLNFLNLLKKGSFVHLPKKLLPKNWKSSLPFSVFLVTCNFLGKGTKLPFLSRFRKLIMFPTRMPLNVWGVAMQHSFNCHLKVEGYVISWHMAHFWFFYFSSYRQMALLTRILCWRPSLNASRSSLHVSLVLSFTTMMIAMITIFSSSTLPIDYIRIIEIKGNFDIPKMQ